MLGQIQRRCGIIKAKLWPPWTWLATSELISLVLTQYHTHHELVIYNKIHWCHGSKYPWFRRFFKAEQFAIYSSEMSNRAVNQRNFTFNMPITAHLTIARRRSMKYDEETKVECYQVKNDLRYTFIMFMLYIDIYKSNKINDTNLSILIFSSIIELVSGNNQNKCEHVEQDTWKLIMVIMPTRRC